MITKVLFSGTPLDSPLFDISLYPITKFSAFSVESKILLPLKDVMDSSIISNTWITLEKQFKRKLPY